MVAVTLTQAEADTLKKEYGDLVTPLPVNLADWDETESKLAPLVKDLDYVCNVAGVVYVECVENQTKEQIANTFDVNIKAAMHITSMAVKYMKERRRGSIVQVSSTSSMVANDGHVPYCASKAAMDMLAKCGAKEFGPFNIRINNINPTVVWTQMGKLAWSDPEKQKTLLSKIPLGRFAEVHEVIEPMLFLLGSEASMITGVCLPVDGGQVVV